VIKTVPNRVGSSVQGLVDGDTHITPKVFRDTDRVYGGVPTIKQPAFFIG